MRWVELNFINKLDTKLFDMDFGFIRKNFELKAFKKNYM